MYNTKTLQEIRWERKQRREKCVYRVLSIVWICVLFFCFCLLKTTPGRFFPDKAIVLPQPA